MAIRTLGLIAGCDVLAMATWFSASAVMQPLASAFGIAAENRSWITGAVQFGFVCGAVASAAIALADWAEPRKLIRSGILLAVLANAAILAIWGCSVVADSAQFSVAVSELAQPEYTGTALTLQMGVGFSITMLTIWLVGAIERQAGWTLAFMLLSAGPAAGIAAMLMLRRRCRI